MFEWTFDDLIVKIRHNNVYVNFFITKSGCLYVLCSEEQLKMFLWVVRDSDKVQENEFKNDLKNLA